MTDETSVVKEEEEEKTKEIKKFFFDRCSNNIRMDRSHSHCGNVYVLAACYVTCYALDCNVFQNFYIVLNRGFKPFAAYNM